MNTRRCHFIVSLLALLALSASALAQPGPDTLSVTGAVSKPTDWTADQLKTQFASDLKSITFTSHDTPHTANAIPLFSLLKAAGAPTDLTMTPKTDPKTKNFPLRFFVLIQGRDGYTAGFSLAELLPDIGHEEAWLALDLDGKPLSESDGPARLIVPSDAKPARWVHEVRTITLVNGVAPTTQPAD